MPVRPTLDELKDYLVEEYDCRWEPVSRKHPSSGKVVHGGIFRRTVDGQELDAPYLNDEMDHRVSGNVIRRICQDLDILPDEVFDWFERQSQN